MFKISICLVLLFIFIIFIFGLANIAKKSDDLMFDLFDEYMKNKNRNNNYNVNKK